MDLEDGPWLPGVLRGAIGQRLLERSRSGDDVAELVRQFFYEPMAKVTRGRNVPPPFVIDVDVSADLMSVHVMLFGFADAWREHVLAALGEALDVGIALGPTAIQRRSAEVLDMRWTRTESAPPVPPGPCVRVRFRTPLKIGGRHALGTDFSDFFFSLLERASGLARWQGMRLETDWGDWRRLFQGLQIDTDGLNPIGYSRRSARQRLGGLPVFGYFDRLDVLNPPERVYPLLSIGSLAHGGASAALGLGRFEVY